MVVLNLSHFLAPLLATTALAASCARNCDFDFYGSEEIDLSPEAGSSMYSGSNNGVTLYYSPPSTGTKAGVMRMVSSGYVCCQVQLQEGFIGTFAGSSDCRVDYALDLTAQAPRVSAVLGYRGFHIC